MKTVIPLDRLWLAEREGLVWRLLRKDTKGVYRLDEEWEGPRRSLYTRLAAYGIQPSRDAEEQLALLPEQLGFRRDEDIEKV